jgi:uncharacterized protein YjbI with pentapeptide repeats
VDLDPLHAEIFRSGPGAWNAWRKNNPTAIPDLTGIALTLSERQMGPANGGPVNLKSACLRDGFLRFATLTAADLESADLHAADLVHARLQQARLTASDLSNALLDHADFSNSVLARAKLSGASLRFATFFSADLQSADMSGADLGHARFDRAQLQDANLSNALLDYADFTGADLKGVNLRGASLYHAKNLTQEQLEESVNDASTILPPFLQNKVPWPDKVKGRVRPQTSFAPQSPSILGVPPTRPRFAWGALALLICGTLGILSFPLLHHAPPPVVPEEDLKQLNASQALHAQSGEVQRVQRDSKEDDAKLFSQSPPGSESAQLANKHAEDVTSQGSPKAATKAPSTPLGKTDVDQAEPARTAPVSGPTTSPLGPDAEGPVKEPVETANNQVTVTSPVVSTQNPSPAVESEIAVRAAAMGGVQSSAIASTAVRLASNQPGTVAVRAASSSAHGMSFSAVAVAALPSAAEEGIEIASPSPEQVPPLPTKKKIGIAVPSVVPPLPLRKPSLDAQAVAVAALPSAAEEGIEIVSASPQEVPPLPKKKIIGIARPSEMPPLLLRKPSLDAQGKLAKPFSAEGGSNLSRATAQRSSTNVRSHSKLPKGAGVVENHAIKAPAHSSASDILAGGL